jgi:hypothetical protein
MREQHEPLQPPLRRDRSRAGARCALGERSKLAVVSGGYMAPLLPAPAGCVTPVLPPNDGWVASHTHTGIPEVRFGASRPLRDSHRTRRCQRKQWPCHSRSVLGLLPTSSSRASHRNHRANSALDGLSLANTAKPAALVITQAALPVPRGSRACGGPCHRYMTASHWPAPASPGRAPALRLQ